MKKLHTYKRGNTDSAHISTIMFANTTVNNRGKEASSMKKSIRKRFNAICIGNMLLFTGYGTLLVLQSSINIVEGLGATATAISFFTSILFNLFVVPFVVRTIGVKKTLIISDFAFMFYVTANFYPTKWLLITAGLVVGLRQAFFWVPTGFVFVYFGLWYSQCSSKSGQACIKEFSGILFAFFQCHAVIGNSISFGVLHFLKTSEEKHYVDENVNSISSLTLNDSVIVVRSLEYCGANDCQNANVTQENIEQYVPTSRTPLYVITGLFLMLMILGTLLHFRFLPDIPLNFDDNPVTLPLNDATKLNSENDDDEVRENGTSANILRQSWKAIKDTLMQMINVNQLLIMPVTIYFGMFVGFIISDITRAYVSCVQGVDMVGINLLIFAFAATVSSYMAGKIASKFGKSVLFMMAAILDLSLYATCLIWIPTEGTQWVIYPIFVAVAVSDGFWQIGIANLYAECFVGSREVSFTYWNCTWAIGFGLQFAWSTSICVREKVYIMIGMLLISLTSTGILTRKKKTSRPRGDI